MTTLEHRPIRPRPRAGTVLVVAARLVVSSALIVVADRLLTPA